MDKKQEQDATRAARGEHAHPATVRREKADAVRKRIMEAFADRPACELKAILLDLVALAEFP